MDWTAPRVVAGLAAMIIMFFAHLHLWAVHRRPHLAFWTVAWGLVLARYALLALLPPFLTGQYSPIFLAYIVIFAVICVLITAGNHALARRRMPWWPIGLLVVSYLWVLATQPWQMSFAWRTIPPYFCLGLVLFLGGRVLIADHTLDKGTRWSAGLAMFTAAAALGLVAPWVMDNPWFAQWGWLSTGLISCWVGVSLLMLHFQTQQLRLLEAQQALDEAARLYRSLADTMGEGLLVYDQRELITYVNPRLGQIVGVDHHRLLGSSMQRLLRPGVLDQRSRQEFQALLREPGRAAPTVEVDRFVRSDGAELSLRVLPGAMYDEAGRFRGMVLLVSDVTNRRRLDRDLAQNRALLQSILGAMDDAVYSLSVDGLRVEHHNRAAEELLGLVAGQPQQNARRLSLAAHADDAPILRRKEQAIARQGHGQWEYRVLRPDGRLAWVRDHTRLVADEQGRPLRHVSVLVDITERREAQRELEQRRQLFQALYESSMDPIVIINRQRLIVSANPAALEFFGFAPEEALGHSTQLAHLDGRMFDKFAREAHAKVERDGSWRGEWPLRHRDGRALLVEMAVSALERDEAGRIKTIMATMRDTTQRKLYEEKLRAAVEEKEVLLREIHHRVKNNMQVIQSLIWMQANQMGDETLQGVFAEVERRISAMSLIHETLYQSETLAQLDLRHYIERLCHSLTDVFEGPGSLIGWDIQCGDVRLDLDKAVSIGLVLNELVTNALKHAFDRSGGTVSIKAAQAGDGWTTISVADDGRGMAARPEGPEGRSLGLFLVEGLVQRQLKGQLQINKGRGTEFIIRFAAGQAVER